MDDLFASAKHLKVGDTVETLNHQFRISGIVEHGKGARKFLPIKTLQELIGAQGKATIFYVKLDNPNNADEVVRAIKNIPGMQQYGVHSLKEYLSLMTSSSIPMLSTFINVVIAIAMIIGFIVIFQAMYAAVMERTREIGILKSLGAGKLYIVNVVLRETVLIAIGGIVLGIVVSYAAKAGLRTKFQTLPMLITSRMGGPGNGHRDCRLAAGSVLSRDQSRAEGPHRRAGVRIVSPPLAPSSDENAPTSLEEWGMMSKRLDPHLALAVCAPVTDASTGLTATGALLACDAPLSVCFAEIFC